MSARAVLIIGAVAALLFGLALVLLPAQILDGFGLGAPAAAQVLSRDVGVTLIGLAVLNWFGRNATREALREPVRPGGGVDRQCHRNCERRVTVCGRGRPERAGCGRTGAD